VPPLPLAPPWILGIYVYEEEALPVVDLQFLVHRDGGLDVAPFQRLVLLSTGGARMAVVADEVSSVRALSPEVLPAPLKIPSRGGEDYFQESMYKGETLYLINRRSKLFVHPSISPPWGSTLEPALSGMRLFLKFVINGNSFAVPVETIYSISDTTLSFQSYKGSSNTVIPLFPLVSFPALKSTKPTRALVFRESESLFAFHVDSICTPSIVNLRTLPIPSLLSGFIQPMLYLGVGVSADNRQMTYLVDLLRFADMFYSQSVVNRI
jgi:chemotaxis signal transduction protein